MKRRVFEVTLKVSIMASDMDRVRQQTLEAHPEFAELPDKEIDDSNINGVICGALLGLGDAGGEGVENLVPGCEGALLAQTNANAAVLTQYMVKELESCAHC